MFFTLQSNTSGWCTAKSFTIATLNLFADPSILVFYRKHLHCYANQHHQYTKFSDNNPFLQFGQEIVNLSLI